MLILVFKIKFQADLCSSDDYATSFELSPTEIPDVGKTITII